MDKVIYMDDYLIKKGKKDHSIVRRFGEQGPCCSQCLHWNSSDGERGECRHPKNLCNGFKIITKSYQRCDIDGFFQKR